MIVLDLQVMGPALVAGLLVLASHVPLGTIVLNRGTIFIDIALAQVAATGVVFGTMMWGTGGFPKSFRSHDAPSGRKATSITSVSTRAKPTRGDMTTAPRP